MLYKDVVAVDAEVDGLLQTAFRHDHIVEGMAFPAILAQHPHIEQHPAVQKILSPHQSGEFFFHFIHLTGGEEAAASDVDAEDGFLILQRKICLMQDGSITTDGQDDIGARKAFFQRKVLYTFHIAGLFQVIPHQDDSFLHQEYPAAQQKAFADYLMEVMGLDRSHCGLGETEHPFTLEFNNKDVRITTNYDEHNVASSMYSVLHEGGHALYELGIRDDLQYTCLAGGVSMGVHESQSRFYENLIGRSRPFVEAIYPKVQEFFPQQLGGVSADQFYRAVNKAQPSLIRTEADELTYCLHVMVRYEIEKQLIGGTLEAKDVPAVWAKLYKEYLGIEVPNDRDGCLQDSHWSGGAFGYFPSYALGSAYGAQMLRRMEQDVDVWGAAAKGDLTPITAWLREKVHQYGGLMEPADVVKNACGDFSAEDYIQYLTRKYTGLYSL